MVARCCIQTKTMKIHFNMTEILKTLAVVLLSNVTHTTEEDLPMIVLIMNHLSQVSVTNIIKNMLLHVLT